MESGRITYIPDGDIIAELLIVNGRKRTALFNGKLWMGIDGRVGCCRGRSEVSALEIFPCDTELIGKHCFVWNGSVNFHGKPARDKSTRAHGSQLPCNRIKYRIIDGIMARSDKGYSAGQGIHQDHVIGVSLRCIRKNTSILYYGIGTSGVNCDIKRGRLGYGQDRVGR